MGKKRREEREEKRGSYATQRSKQHRKNVLITIGIFSLIGVIVGASAYNFVTGDTKAPGSPPNSGALGDEHEHASLIVKIFGDKFDFTTPAYQIKSSWIHFESADGRTIHRHSSGVTMGYLFGTLGLGVDDECFIFADGREFCTNEEYSLKFYINHDPVSEILTHVLQEGDRLLISYGNESAQEIESQLIELDAQAILG